MNIQESHNTPFVWRSIPILSFVSSQKAKGIIITFAVILAFVITSLASIYYGMYLFKVKKAEAYDVFLENVVQAKLNILPNLFKGYFSSSPERIMIDVKHQDFQKIAYKREQALTNGILITSADDYVPAKIRYQGKTIRVKLRLKGDWTDHLLDEKWSFRVKVKGENTLFGMKQFSIHHPRTRNFVYEWIVHKALGREDVLALRYDFIEVTLNGKDLGIYALEEHFEKRLIEHNKYREGPILKFNENILWADRAAHHRGGNLSPTGLQSEDLSNIDLFKTTATLGDPSLYQQFIIAHNLLESFRNKELPTHKVFNINKLAKLFALSDLLGAPHGVIWHNLRFYYNPITSRLEPIAFDGNAGKPTEQIVGSNRDLVEPQSKFKDIVFADEIFFEEYIRVLQRVSTEAYLDELLTELDEELREKLNILYKEFPYFHFSKNIFYQNQKVIQHTLNPVKGLHAYYRKSSDSHITLELANIQALPIEVLDAQAMPIEGSGATYKESVRFQPSHKVILQARIPLRSLDYQSVSLEFPPGLAWDESMSKNLVVNYRILGTNRMRRETVFSWPRLYGDFVEKDFIRQQPNFDQFDFISVDESGKKVLVKPGDWNLSTNLIIPQGYVVICREGTRLNLTNSATILSYSPLDFKGSEEDPIVIQSEDSTGQGLVVLNAGQMSVLDYVTFQNLGNPSQNGWELTGAVTFYEAPVYCSHCQFLANRAEDALNIIRSAFTIDKTLFSHAFSDAFDADFGEGKILNTSFVATGNDAIDISGSVVEIQAILINGAGDKGLSVGENSELKADEVELVDVEIAVASKDMSKVTINNIKMRECEIGFTAYQKKPEFAPALIAVQGLKMDKITIPYLIEENSTITVDGAVIDANSKNVKSTLYGVVHGKSSK